MKFWKLAFLVIIMSIYKLTYNFFCIGTVLGGTMELHGTNISLACFHGNSLKAKSWALFSLKEPCISFATEAQQVANDDGQLTGYISTSELLRLLMMIHLNIMKINRQKCVSR